MCSVTQSCSTLCDPMDSSLPGSSVHGIFQATILEQVVIFLLQQIFPTQGSNLQHLHLLHWQADSLPLSHKGSPHTILDLSQKAEKWKQYKLCPKTYYAGLLFSLPLSLFVTHLLCQIQILYYIFLYLLHEGRTIFYSSYISNTIPSTLPTPNYNECVDKCMTWT